MNTPPRRHYLQSALTRIETIALVCALGIFAFVLYSAFFMRNTRPRGGLLTEQLNNGRQIWMAMRDYASERTHGGAFPAYRDFDAKTGLFANSNEAFEVLMPRYLNDKRVFFNRDSAWCRVMPRTEATEYQLRAGENDWCYVRGLRDGAPSPWPLLANAFAPGTTHYVADPKQPGGVWEGKKAVVIHGGGSAEIIDTTKSGETYFIARRDKPTANAFAKDGEWLAGEHVEVLYPLPETPSNPTRTRR